MWAKIKDTLEKTRVQLFDGNVTVPKVILWLIGVICLLAGIIYGLRMAPLTHGVAIGCNNGNQFYDDKEEEEA